MYKEIGYMLIGYKRRRISKYYMKQSTVFLGFFKSWQLKDKDIHKSILKSIHASTKFLSIAQRKKEKKKGAKVKARMHFHILEGQT